MSGESNWRIPTDAEAYFSQQEKKVAWEERRPRIRKASDIMGPALGPSAIQLDDLDGEVAAFNGMYLVQPGALSSPDPTKWWAGTTIADRETGGTQYLSTFLPGDTPHVQMRRGFAISGDGAVRQFSPWAESAGGETEAVYSFFEIASSQNVGNNAWGRLGFGSAATGDGWSYSGGGGTARVFTCTDPGVYTINFAWTWSGNNQGIRQGNVSYNGSWVPERVAQVPGHAAACPQMVSITRRFASGDEIWLEVRQTSGGTLGMAFATASFVKQGS